MTTTIVLYVSLLIVLTATAVSLAMRDLNAANQARIEGTEEQKHSTLKLLTTPVEETFQGSFTNRIDWRFRQLIYQTGLNIGVEPAFLFMVLVGLLVGGGLFVWRDDPLVGVAGMLIGMATPLGYYIYLRAQRLSAIREQLPDCLDLMSRAVRAGETLDQAISQVGHSMSAPLGIEFDRCARQLDMGLAMPSAMRSLTFRAPLTETRILAATLNVQRRSGGNLAIMLDRLAGVIRDRLSYQRQFLAATGASRIATLLIAVIGPIVFAVMLTFQPDYMGQFFELPGGWVLLSTAMVLQVVGLTWVLAMLQNDY